MQPSPLVTVYLVNYNYGAYIEQSIESVLIQDFDDYELLIIDDGSTDNSMEIINKYRKNKNVHIIEQKNKGLNTTNNIALKLSSGKYIIRLDADDYLTEDALRKMANILEDNQNLVMVFPDYFEIDKDNQVIGQVQRHDFDNEVTLFDQPAHGACTMIKKEILLEVGGYDESFNRQDGYDLWLKILHGNYKFKNINKPLFYYRDHGNNLTKDEKLLLETRSKIIEKHVNKYKNKIKTIALIPVRGPKLDPRSNPLENLGSKPLINWTIDSVLNSKLIDEIIVSTPDNSVINHIEKYYSGKVVLHERNERLARINKNISPTLLDALDFYESNHNVPDAIMVLNIESPFRSSVYIDKAINVMRLFNVDSVIGVTIEDDIFYTHDGNGLVPYTKIDGLKLERDILYRKVGGMSLVSRKYFKNTNKIFGGRIGHIQLDKQSAFMINSLYDWKLSNFLSQKEEGV